MDHGGFSEESLQAVIDMLDFAADSAGDIYFPAKKKKCPPGTTAIGAGYCRNPEPSKYGFVPAIKKHCPPKTTAIGAGFCRVNFAENDLTGECNQKEKRKQQAQTRTPEQQQADRQRGQEMQGRDTVPSGVRKQAAEKAAKTRQKCSGNKPKPQPGQPG